MTRKGNRRFAKSEKELIKVWLLQVLASQERALATYQTIQGGWAEAHLGKVRAYYESNAGFVRHLLAILEGKPCKPAARKGVGNGTD